ncbi:MAG: hypothetical protein ABSH07_02360 [Candidatus Dormibacteria bacterium]|jgi:hypothetical protein
MAASPPSTWTFHIGIFREGPPWPDLPNDTTEWRKTLVGDLHPARAARMGAAWQIAPDDLRVCPAEPLTEQAVWCLFSVADPSSSVRAWDHLKEAVPAGRWFTIPLGPGAIANLTVEDESD